MPLVILDRPLKMTTFVVSQRDGDWIFTIADKFERGVVVVAEDFMSECFIWKMHGDGIVLAPGDIDRPGRFEKQSRYIKKMRANTVNATLNDNVRYARHASGSVDGVHF